MLKQQRLNIIQELLSQKEIVQVSDLTNILNVTEMTVRRDLKTLEDAGKLLRIHGGAKPVDNSFNKELSHIEKQEIMIEEKKYISKKSKALYQKSIEQANQANNNYLII